MLPSQEIVIDKIFKVMGQIQKTRNNCKNKIFILYDFLKLATIFA